MNFDQTNPCVTRIIYDDQADRKKRESQSPRHRPTPSKILQIFQFVNQESRNDPKISLKKPKTSSDTFVQSYFDDTFASQEYGQ